MLLRLNRHTTRRALSSLLMMGLFSASGWSGSSLATLLTTSPMVAPKADLTAEQDTLLTQEPSTPEPAKTITGHKTLDHLYAYDDQPLGQRIPVIVVPGRVQERQFSPWWKKLGDAVKKSPSINQHYKFYLFLYDSGETLAELTEAFSAEYGSINQWLPANRPVQIVTYSLGGLFVRDTFLLHPELLKRVQTIYGLTVPYQGSPMFDPDWFTRYLDHFSPVRKLWDRVAYRAYMLNKKNLLTGLSWDNFDQSRPSYFSRREQKERNRGETVRQQVPMDAEPRLTAHPEATRAFKQRLIIYGSFLKNKYTHPGWEAPKLPVISTVMAAPKVVLGSLFPFYGTSVHAVFHYMNLQLANLPTYSPDNPWGINEHLYRYNDGVIPLSSMLYLPPRNQPYRENLDGLVQAADVCKVRIFEGTDHVEMGHYRWPPGLLKTADSLQPELPEKMPIQWLLWDIEHQRCS